MAIFNSYVKLPEGKPGKPSISIRAIEKPWQTVNVITRGEISHLQPMVVVYLPTKLGDLWGKSWVQTIRSCDG